MFSSKKKFNQFTKEAKQLTINTLRNDLKKQQEPFHYKLIIPLKVTDEQANDVIIDEIIIQPPLSSHFLPKVNDIKEKFYPLSYVFRMSTFKAIESFIEGTQPTDEISTNIMFHINKTIAGLDDNLTELNSKFEIAIMHLMTENELILTADGQVVNKDWFYGSGGLSIPDYKYIMKIITSRFFFYPEEATETLYHLEWNQDDQI